MRVNLSESNGQIRILLGAIIAVVGSHYFGLMVLLGFGVMFTGMYFRFPVTDVHETTQHSLTENRYLGLLPKLNPQPLFIFNAEGEIVFTNDTAQTTFPAIRCFSELVDSDAKAFIQENKIEHHQYRSDDGKLYSLFCRNVSSLSEILVYATDVTEVLSLHDEIIETQKEIVYTMGEIGETRSKETGDHVKRVAEYSEALALLIGLDKNEAQMIKFASPLHDIGKVGIPDNILNKPDRLTFDEFEIMKGHAKLGYELLNHSERPILKAAAIIAGEHHEKWDGSGYPHGLIGEDIHIYGRITAIADVFDALGTERVYKPAWPIEKIITLFKEERGKHFDPVLVDLLLNNLETFLAIRAKYSR
ncbi:HD domain-containing phosphohydrolase [Vibrio sp. 1CM24A]|uniref:HD-GYP domain-containing protein n=1 Tax=Vibrio sp. 1CM24A TaxID=2929165 RepID=UPI0020C036DA|nr:HD domain-containing protein [Vibrio sp. 1CM24A]